MEQESNYFQLFFANDNRNTNIIFSNNPEPEIIFSDEIIEEILNDLKKLLIVKKTYKNIKISQNIKLKEEIYNKIKNKYNNTYNNYFTDTTLDNFLIGLRT